MTKLKHAACSIPHSHTVHATEDAAASRMSLPLPCRSGSEPRAGSEIVVRGGRSQEGDGGDCGRPGDRDREWDMGQPNPDFEHDFGNDDEARDWPGTPKILGFTYFQI